MFQRVHSHKSRSLVNSIPAVPVILLSDNPAIVFNGIVDYISYESTFYLALWPNLSIRQMKFNDINKQESPNICSFAKPACFDTHSISK